jgi:hypothetical protein
MLPISLGVLKRLQPGQMRLAIRLESLHGAYAFVFALLRRKRIARLQRADPRLRHANHLSQQAQKSLVHLLARFRSRRGPGFDLRTKRLIRRSAEILASRLHRGDDLRAKPTTQQCPAQRYSMLPLSRARVLRRAVATLQSNDPLPRVQRAGPYVGTSIPSLAQLPSQLPSLTNPTITL